MTGALVEVGLHECVSCLRCSCTFARAHPACPACLSEDRLAKVPALVEALKYAEQIIPHADVGSHVRKTATELITAALAAWESA